MGSQLNGVMIYLAIIVYGCIWCFIGSVLSPLLRRVLRCQAETATVAMLVICVVGFVVGLLVAFEADLPV